MQTIQKRALPCFVLFFLGLLAAPLGATEGAEGAVLDDGAVIAAEVEQAETEVQVAAEAAEVQIDMEEAAAEAVAVEALEQARPQDAVVAEARQGKLSELRAERKRSTRAWLKMAFGASDPTDYADGLGLGESSQRQLADNRREWLRFAFVFGE